MPLRSPRMVTILPQAVQIVAKVTDLPISIDSANVEAVDAALSVYDGKAILNSITGEEKALAQFLPIVKKGTFRRLCQRSLNLNLIVKSN